MIKMIRVDHRLLHGQVAISWYGYVGANCILIANDAVAEDATRKSLIKLAKPTGSKLVIMPIVESISSLNSGITDKYQLMIVVESVHDAYLLIAGMHAKPKELNLGGTKEANGTKSVSAAVNITPQDKKDLAEIETMGVSIFSQQVPTSTKEKLNFIE